MTALSSCPLVLIKRIDLWVRVYACSVTHSCLTLCDPTDCSPPGFFVRGILQARILERVAMPSSRGGTPRQSQRQSSILKPSHAGQSPGGSRTILREEAGPCPPHTWVTRSVSPDLFASSPTLSFCQSIVHKHCHNQLLKGAVHLSRVYPIHTAVPCLINTFYSSKIYFCINTSQHTSQCSFTPPRFPHYMEIFHSDAFLPPGIFLHNFQDSCHIGEPELKPGRVLCFPTLLNPQQDPAWHQPHARRAQ